MQPPSPHHQASGVGFLRIILQALLCVGVAVICLLSSNPLRLGTWQSRRSPATGGAATPLRYNLGTVTIVRGLPTPLPSPLAGFAPHPSPLVANATANMSAAVDLGTRNHLGFVPLECLSSRTVLPMHEIAKVYRHKLQRDFLESYGLSEAAMTLGRPGGAPLPPAPPGKEVPAANTRYCVHHRRVEFVPRAFDAQPPVANFTTLSKCGIREFIKGVSEGGVWHNGTGNRADADATYAVEGCEMTPNLTRDAILSALRGRRIVFSGDSMVRQMYLRLIELIRVDRPALEPFLDFAEHFYHENSYYAANRTADALVIGRDFPQAGRLPIQDPVLELLFVWDPQPNQYSKLPFTLLNTTDIIAAHMYWWTEAQGFSSIDSYVSEVGDFMRNATGGVRFFYMTTPRALPPSAIGNLHARNAYVKSKWDELRHPQVNVLDFASFTSKRSFPRTRDGMHYQCSFRRGYPKAIKLRKSKILDGGCGDTVNRNWAHVLVAALSAPLT